MKCDNRISLTTIPAISAIYFALLQCGYEYYSVERSKEHIQAVETFHQSVSFPPWFFEVKQSACSVYPYWPRAAMLETASFYLKPDYHDFSDFKKYRDLVLSAGNISDDERNVHFWNWVKDFPKAIKTVIDSDAFVKYLSWESCWAEQQNAIYTEELSLVQTCLERCVSKYQSPVKRIRIVLSPIKCVYSSDYHLVDDCFVFSSGRFQVESVIHEFLHHVVHPIVLNHRDSILSHKRRYPEIDNSYYLARNDAGQLNAFEEFVVRSLTKTFSSKAPLPDLDAFISGINQ